MAASQSKPDLETLRRRLSDARLQLQRDDDAEEKTTQRLERALRSMVQAGRSNAFQQQEVPRLRQELEDIQNRREKLLARIKKLEADLANAQPGTLSKTGRFFDLCRIWVAEKFATLLARAGLKTYPILTAPLIVALLAALIGWTLTSKNTTPQSAHGDSTKHESTQPQNTAPIPLLGTPANPITPPQATPTITPRKSSTRTVTSSPTLRPDVKAITDQLGPTTNVARLRALRELLNHIPQDLDGLELTHLLGPSSSNSRADQFDLLLPRLGPVDPLAVPDILGDTTSLTRERLVRLLAKKLPPKITPAHAVQILGDSTSEHRFKMLKYLAPKIERPIDLWGLQQLGGIFDDSQRDRMMLLLAQTAEIPGGRMHQTLGEYLGR